MNYGLVSNLRIVRCTFDKWDVKEQNLTIFVGIRTSGHGSYEYAS